MKSTVTLEAKEVRIIIAKFLEIKEEQVLPLRYNFAVEGMTEKEIAAKIEEAKE